MAVRFGEAEHVPADPARGTGRREAVLDEVTGEFARCLNEGPDCAGNVEWRYVGERVWPRCEKHGKDRDRQRSRSLERYADSPTPPRWFDPTIAGESW